VQMEEPVTFFTRLKKADPKSERCVDCNRPNPQWASVNNAAFFCIDCSGRHRSIGVHLSFVRSCTMDGWNAKQRALMERGGNGRLLAFLSEHGVPSNLGIDKRYATPECIAYRRILKAEAEGCSPPSAAQAITEAKKATLQNAAPRRSSSGPAMSMSGGAAGIEARPGESESAYVARQHQEQLEAKERMRAKFGQSSGPSSNGAHMQGLGSDGGRLQQADDWGFDADWISGSMAGALTKATSLASNATLVVANVSSVAMQQAQRVAEQAQSSEAQNKLSSVTSSATNLLNSAVTSDTVQQGWSTMSSWFSAGAQQVAGALTEPEYSPQQHIPREEGSMSGFTAEELAIIQRGSKQQAQPTVNDDDEWGDGDGWGEQEQPQQPPPQQQQEHPRPAVTRAPPRAKPTPVAKLPVTKVAVAQAPAASTEDGWGDEDDWGDEW